MYVLGVIHGAAVRSGVFGKVAAEAGHSLEEWSLAWGTPPPRPIEDYGAVFVFGGAMHADQDDHHPWLRDEHDFLQQLLGFGVPLLGVCLGAQLIAKACDVWVGRASESEIGWCDVELLDGAERDPLLGVLPPRFKAFQWHHYTYEVPPAAVELARSRVCTQAFRLGDAAWGIQFHAEVTQAQILGWLDEAAHELSGPVDELVAETSRRIGDWNDLGGRLCGSFLRVAERASAGI